MFTNTLLEFGEIPGSNNKALYGQLIIKNEVSSSVKWLLIEQGPPNLIGKHLMDGDKYKNYY